MMDFIRHKRAMVLAKLSFLSPHGITGTFSFSRIIKLTSIILFLFIYGVSNASESRSGSVYFNHLTIEDGLSGNIISKIIEDQYGYLWIATQNGLNRYNGASINTYMHDPLDSSSIPGNEIEALAIDKTGSLWIGTKNGLCRFRYEDEKFDRFFQFDEGEKNFITLLFVTRTNQLLIGNQSGLFCFNRKTGRFDAIINDPGLKLNAPQCMVEDSHGNIYMGTWEKGFYRITENLQNKTHEYIEIPGHKSSNSTNNIESILIDQNGTLWFGTRDGLIIGREIQEMGVTRFAYSLFKPGSEGHSKIPGTDVHTLCQDNSGRIWIGCENGLNLYDPGTKEIVSLVYDPDNPHSLSNNDIRYLFRDKNGNIWIGTYQGGVNVCYQNHEPFRDYFPIINRAVNQNTRFVKSVFTDRENFIWIGTDDGLRKFSANGELLQTYAHDPANIHSLSIGGVSAMYEDRKRRFWIGTWGGGMHELDRTTGKITRFPHPESTTDKSRSQIDNTVRSIAEDSKGNIWIGNMRGYLDKYSPETKTFEHYFINIEELNINATILFVTVDKKDNVWVGTLGGGLVCFDPFRQQFIRYSVRSKPNNQVNSTINSINVYSVLFSADNKLWIGTSDGLNMLDLITREFSYYTTEDGLASNVIYSILQDDHGNLWMSTLKGITKFNPGRNVFINYDQRDGVLINSESGFKSSSGWLFFGGVNGINTINPSVLKENNTIPSIVFSDFKIYNKPVGIGYDSPIGKHINLLDEIELRYNQNDFTIGFVALNFINHEKNQYACKLEGYDKDWVALGTSQEARYANLDPGEYTFHVIASNNDGLWNKTGRILRIKILPPWWMTLIFRILILLVVFGIIISWILVRTSRLKHQQMKLRQLVNERTSEIEVQKIRLQDQADILMQTNQLLMEKQNEIQQQKEAIAEQNEKLALKNKLLEEQKNKILEQKNREHEMAEKLHEADQMKLRFFTNISHEFRTPLTLILGPVEKLLSEFKSRPDFMDKARVIQRNTLRLLRLINQFLDLSKLEAGVIRLSLSRGEIIQYIREIVDAYHFSARQKNIDYNFICRTDSLYCHFDADKIEKILYNLLSNAFKFTQPEGKIHVLVETMNHDASVPDQEPDYIRIIISNSGKGISPEELPRIFDRFYQGDLKNNLSNPGTGIGLALTQELITVYRGKIEVYSEPDKGARFIVTLPISTRFFSEEEIDSQLSEAYIQKSLIVETGFQQSVSNNREVEDSPSDQEDDPLENGAKITLLVIDDDSDIRKFIRDEFAGEYRIIEARNGQEGFEKAVKYLPGMIISDVIMPEMDGNELCARLKTHEPTCHIPVIILTAKASADDQIESIETGADVYISKPFDVRLLRTHVINLLAAREKLKEIYRRELTIRPSDVTVKSSDEKLMDRIVRFMNENLSNPDFGVEELGKEVGLSRTHLYRKIKQMTHLTAIEFVRNMRLQRAAQLFRQNRMHVAEVAYMSGFKELSYFRKIFREVYGVSPQEFIIKHHQIN